MTDQIAAIRRDLAAWSVGKPKAVQRAVIHLRGWLDVLACPPDEGSDVDVLACTARAVETLRATVARS